MEHNTLIKQANEALHHAQKNSGKIILITGGPTCEDIDPVRFISNRSTGKMGIECALAAKELGLSPILILGPTCLKISDNTIPIVNIRSAQDLFITINHLFDNCIYLIMSAAVADFTPINTSQTKLKKVDVEDENQELVLHLKRTKDILFELNNSSSRSSKYIAGFSLDTSMNINEGLRKLRDKGLDLIVINSTAAFKKNYSTIKIISKDNNKIDLIDNTKFDTAKTIINELVRLEFLNNLKRDINE